MKLIDVDLLDKPHYAEDDNVTGDGMTYAEMDAYNEGIDVAWGRIERAPEVTIAEIPSRGHWEEYDRCSVCGDKPFAEEGLDVREYYNYCPRCGARME